MCMSVNNIYRSDELSCQVDPHLELGLDRSSLDRLRNIIAEIGTSEGNDGGLRGHAEARRSHYSQAVYQYDLSPCDEGLCAVSHVRRRPGQEAVGLPMESGAGLRQRIDAVLGDHPRQPSGTVTR